MSDLEQDAKDEAENNLVVKNDQGEIQQDNGVRMLEKESYERVIDGYRLAAEACSHLATIEPDQRQFWVPMRMNLDQLRRATIQYAGVEDAIRVKETADVGSAMPWRDARDRLYEGLKQVEGGLRQLAVCFRSDVALAKMAHTVEEMTVKLKARSQAMMRRSALASGLILP